MADLRHTWPGFGACSAKRSIKLKAARAVENNPLKNGSSSLEKIVLLSGRGLCWLTILKSMFCWVVKRKGLKGGIIPEKRTVSWVLSHLNCNLSPTIDWRVDLEQIKSRWHSLEDCSSLKAFPPSRWWTAFSFKNTCCPFPQASPSSRKEHTLMLVSHSLWLPSWSFKSQYSLRQEVFTSESTTSVPNRGCSAGLLPDRHQGEPHLTYHGPVA